MERREPALVPQWLKNTGNQNGGGSVSHSDDQSAFVRNKSSLNINGHDFGRSFSSGKITSPYFRRSSSNNGSGHLRSHSSCGRNWNDSDWEKDIYDSHDKDKSVLWDLHRQDFSDALGNTSFSKFERDGLRHSQSMVSGKRGGTWSKKVVTSSSPPGGSNTNGLHPKGITSGRVSKTMLERDFPCLGVEERAVTPEVGRVASPVLSSAIQSLPISTSTNISGEKWTSALAEVPTLVRSNGTGVSSVQQATSSNSESVASGTNTSLNMAEAVAQGPTRAQTATTQLSVGTQRLEELAIKQSRQLIPVMTSVPKTLVLNSSDKLKSKVGQQQYPLSPSLAVDHSPRGGSVKGVVSKASNIGKLHVLKPVREKNVTPPVVKDNLSPTNGSKPVSSTNAAPSVSGSANRGSLKNPGHDHKPVLDKRPSSQAQSRSDFFNLVRKKSMANSSVAHSQEGSSQSVLNTSAAVSSSFSDKAAETEFVDAPNTSQDGDGSFGVSLSRNLSSVISSDLNCNGNACLGLKHDSDGDKLPSSDPVFSEEEETAFLRSMGWEENADEGGLTEEEINAFFKDVAKYINSSPSLKILQGVQPKFLFPFDSPIGGISPGLSSPDAKLES